MESSGQEQPSESVFIKEDEMRMKTIPEEDESDLEDCELQGGGKWETDSNRSEIHSIGSSKIRELEKDFQDSPQNSSLCLSSDESMGDAWESGFEIEKEILNQQEDVEDILPTIRHLWE